MTGNTNTPKQNAPLNFRTSNSLVTTRVPHYATKTTTANSVVPGLHRPNTNGVPSNIYQHDFEGPAFKARPIKHWRRQLVPTSVNDTGGGPSQPIGSSGQRNATVGLLMDRPGAVSYVGDASCKCVSQPGNSYTISEHFLEGPKKKEGTKVENQGVIVIDNGFENGGYENGGYEINTGIYNTRYICCTPQNNVIKSASSLLSRAYYSDTTGYLKSRCKTYQQNASINRKSGVTYLSPDEQHIWATSSANGSQVYQTNDIYKPRVNPYACGGSGASTVIFKPNNYQYSVQGAVDSSTRIEKLKLNTINTNANSLRSAFGNEAASACRFTGSSDTPYFLKNKYQPPICSETNLIARYRQNKRICSL